MNSDTIRINDLDYIRELNEKIAESQKVNDSIVIYRLFVGRNLLFFNFNLAKTKNSNEVFGRVREKARNKA